MNNRISEQLPIIVRGDDDDGGEVVSDDYGEESWP